MRSRRESLAEFEKFKQFCGERVGRRFWEIFMRSRRESVAEFEKI